MRIFSIWPQNETGNGLCVQERGRHFKKNKKKTPGSKSGAYKEHLEEGCWCGKAAGLGMFMHTLLQKFQQKNLNFLLNETCICRCRVSRPLWSLSFHFYFHLGDFSCAFIHHFEIFKASPSCHLSKLALMLAKI